MVFTNVIFSTILIYFLRGLECVITGHYTLSVQDIEFTTLSQLQISKARGVSDCAASCFGNILCQSFAFRRSTTNCKLYPKCPDPQCDTATANNGVNIYCKALTSLPQNCMEIMKTGRTCSRVYHVAVPAGLMKEVYCEMDISGGGWTVFQKRIDGSVDFYRGWSEYKQGFGDPDGEHWLGNDVIHLLSHQHENTSLYIYMEDWNNQVKSDLYTEFRIAGETDKYRLHVVHAGGTVTFSCLVNSNTQFTHDRMLFSTNDVDNDMSAQSPPCAEYATGAWWYNSCLTSNLNGQYLGPAATDDHTSSSSSSTFPQNCNEVKQNGETQSGVYTIYITPTLVTEVYCEMVIAGGGWTVFQKRVDGSVDFNKKWTEYKSGFGNSSGEYWLGNDVIHLLSHQHENTSLYIYMEDWNNQVKSDLYTEFRIADETDKYRLHVVYAGGTANFSCLTSANEFTHHGMQFSTFDSDNDQYSQSCAVIAKGAWWYNKCLTSNLNGQYLGSSVTNDFTSDSCKGFTHDYRPLKTVFMMLK